MSRAARTYHWWLNQGTHYDPIYAAYGTEFDDLLLPSGHTWNEGSYNSTTEGTYSLTATDGSTIDVVLEKFALKIDPSNLYTLIQEGLGADNVTDVTTDGQNIGTLYETGKGMVYLASGTLPTLDNDNGFSTLIKFGAGASGLISQRSDNYWRPLHGVTPGYCVRFVWRFDAGSDGLQRRMIYNNALSGSTATDAGLHIRKTTGDKIQLICYKKVSGQQVYSYTTTQGVNVASGVIWVTVNINGTGASAGSINIKTESGVDVTETFTVSAGADVTPSGGMMNIAIDPLQSVGAVQIMPRIATAGEITAWKTYNPARHSTEFLIKNRDFNPSIEANVFSNSAGTTPITDGGNMRYTKDAAISPFGALPEWISTSDGVAPLWTQNAGKSYALYDGTKNIIPSSVAGVTDRDALTPEGCGKFTLFIIASNTDVTNGSHFLAGDDNSDVYMVQTGENYVGGAPSPYMVIHPNSGFATNFGDIPAFAGDNIYILIRNKANIKQANRDVTTFQETTNQDPFAVKQIGRTANGLTAWSHAGKNYRVIKYSGVMSEARALAIRAELKTFYGIA
jgi:hypothetical protein